MNRRPAVIALATVATVGAIALLLPAGVRIAAHRGLAVLGFGDTRGGLVSLGLRRVEIVGIAIGGKSTASIAVTFSPHELLGLRLDTIEIFDVALRGAVTPTGALTLDGYTAPPATSGAAKPIALPASQVRIDHVSLALETPVGSVDISGTGKLVPVVGGLSLTGDLAVTRGGLAASAPLDFTLSPSGWALALNPVTLTFPGKAGVQGVVSGQIALAGSTGAPIAGKAHIGGKDFSIGAVAIRSLVFDYDLGAGGQSAVLQLVPANGGAGIDGALTSDARGITARLKAALTDVGPYAQALGAAAATGPLQVDLSFNLAPAGVNAAPRPATLNLTYDGIAPGGVQVRNGKLAASATLDTATSTLALTSCGKISADAVTVASVGLANLSGCVGPAGDRPAYSQDRTTGRISLAGAVTDLSATSPGGADSVADIKVHALHASATFVDDLLAGFDAGMDGANLALPRLGAGFRNVAMKASSISADGAVTGSITGTFAPTSPNGPALPVAGILTGRIGDHLALALTAGAKDHLPVITAIVTERNARLDMAPTEIGKAGADLLRLTPGLTAAMSKLSGAVGLHAEADWSAPGKGLNSRGGITLKDFGAATPNFTAEGVDATIALTSLKPLITADRQKLTVKRLLVGLPLTDGEVIFGLDKRNVLNIADAHWSIAGGTVSTYDQKLDLYGPDQKLAVVVKNVDLAQLLTAANVNGLSGEGTLDGAAPLRHLGDTILVEHGFLRANAPGLLRYDPAETPAFLQGQPGEGTAILRDALKDFHYQELSLSIDGVLGGEEKIKLSVKGANPKLYGGSPIALTLNLSGALDSIARSSIEAYTKPTETARKNLRKTPGGKK